MVYEKILQGLRSCHTNSIPFTSTTSDKKHEEAVVDRFLETGLTLVTKENYPCGTQEYEEWLYTNKIFMPNNTIMRHPCGENRAPDIAICEHNRITLIECKSVAKNGLQFNSSLPHNSIIYILTIGKQTILLRGNHIILDQDRKVFQDYENDLNLVPRPTHPSIKARIRLFYSILAEHRIYGDYGRACSQQIFDEMMGIVSEPPVMFYNYTPPFTVVDVISLYDERIVIPINAMPSGLRLIEGSLASFTRGNLRLV